MQEYKTNHIALHLEEMRDQTGKVVGRGVYLLLCIARS